MSGPGIATADGTRAENPLGAIAIPIAIVGILLSFLALSGIYVSLILSFVSLALGAVGLTMARRRGTPARWAIVAISLAGASFIVGAGCWALPHLLFVLADRWT